MAGLLALLLLLCPNLSYATRSSLQGTPIAWGSNGAGQTNVPASLTNVIAIAAGYYHNLAVKADGTVVGWGWNGSGQATAPAGLSGVVDVAAGFGHSLALRNNGTVVAWGDNSSYQTNVPAGLSGVIAIAAGDYFSLALKSDHTVVAWGANNYGQATVPAIYYPVTAIAAGANHSLALYNNGGNFYVVGWGLNTAGQADSAGPGVSAIAAGTDFSLGIAGGSVGGWGGNYYGQITIPSGALSGVTAIAAGNYHALALKSDRTVVAWGDNTSGQTSVPAGLVNVVAISAGGMHSLALRVEPVVITSQPQSKTVNLGSTATFTVGAKGTPPILLQWVKNGSPIIGETNGTLTIDPVTAADAGNYAVWLWNPVMPPNTWISTTNAVLTVNIPPSITQNPASQDVLAGAAVNFSVTASGTAPLHYQWRFNNTNISGATASNYAIASAQVTNAGNYLAVVTNNFGSVTSQVAVLGVHKLPTIVTQPQGQSVLAGSSVSFTVVATDATTYQWQKNGSLIQDATNNIYSINSVAAGDAAIYRVAVSNAYGGLWSSNALLTVQTLPAGSQDLKIFPWGERWVWNGTDYVDIYPPDGLSDIMAISSGITHSLCLSSNGMVIGWGDNLYGQAGPPGSLAGVVEISAGGYHSLARKQDGTVVAWGRNNYGQAAVPANVSNIVDIAAGGNHSLALKNDGTVLGWGNSASGQTVPSPSVGNSNFKALAAGSDHSLGLRSNTTVAAWGNNDYNQTRVPAGLTNVTAVAAGDRHSLALRTNGRVVAWGDNTFGQTNVPPDLSNVVAIACGANHSLALKTNGAVVCWGQDNYDQCGSSTMLAVRAIAAGAAHSLALKKVLLQFNDPVRLTNNAVRITAGNEDGSAVTAQKFSQVSLRASTNLNLSFTNWPQASGCVLTNGVLQLDDRATNAPRRFYIIVQ